MGHSPRGLKESDTTEPLKNNNSDLLYPHLHLTDGETEAQRG